MWCVRCWCIFGNTLFLSHQTQTRCVVCTTIDVSFYDFILKMRTNSARDTCDSLLLNVKTKFYNQLSYHWNTNNKKKLTHTAKHTNLIRKAIFENDNRSFSDKRGKSVIRSEARKLTKIKCPVSSIRRWRDNFDSFDMCLRCVNYIFTMRREILAVFTLYFFFIFQFVVFISHVWEMLAFPNWILFEIKVINPTLKKKLQTMEYFFVSCLSAFAWDENYTNEEIMKSSQHTKHIRVSSWKMFKSKFQTLFDYYIIQM